MIFQPIKNFNLALSAHLAYDAFYVLKGKFMNKYEQQVKQFHKLMEMAIDAPYTPDLLELRQKLINEEVSELNVEIDSLIKELKQTGTVRKETKLKMFKELADLQYVLSGMVVALGIPMEEVFARVQKSNLSKLVNGKPLKREDGKVLKGPNYQKPDLSDLA